MPVEYEKAIASHHLHNREAIAVHKPFSRDKTNFMSQIDVFKRFDKDGIELVINTVTGEAFATISGYSRMSGIKANTISNRLSRGYKGIHKSEPRVAKIQTAGGLQGVHLIPEDVIADWVVDDCSELAKLMLKVGCRMYLYHLAGYEIKVQEPAQRQIEPLKRETQAQLLLALKGVFDFQPDDRTAVTLKAHLTNLIEVAQVTDTVPQLLSVTEVCQMHGIILPVNKDSVLGRKVAAEWRSLHSGDPQTCVKHVGTGHRTTDIKVYPVEFFERIIAIAQEYLG